MIQHLTSIDDSLLLDRAFYVACGSKNMSHPRRHLLFSLYNILMHIVAKYSSMFLTEKI